MNNRIIFFVTIIITTLILISSALIAYFKFKPEEELWEKYEAYVFSIFWPSTSCTTKYYNNYECFDKIKNLSIEKYFIIHGLWPNYFTGQLPGDCNQKEEIIPKFEGEFLDIMQKSMPGLYSNDTYFWSHEYNKHGYCYNKRYYYNARTEYKKYFEKTLSLFNSGFKNLMEDILPDSLGVYNISTKKFQNLLYYSPMKLKSNQYVLICDTKYHQLSEIRFVYDMSFNLVNVTVGSNTCKEYFFLNFTDTSKIPVYEKYDFYIFALFWHPTDCKSKNNDKNCYKIIKQKELNTFSIHGLWPSYKNGIIPQTCNVGMDIEILDDGSELFNKLNESWFSVIGDNEYLWKNEYNKHGYCYVKKLGKEINDYILYFNKTIDIYNDHNLKDIFNDIYNWIFPGIQKLNRTYLEPKLNEKFGNNTYTLNCIIINNNYYLSELRLKLDLDFNIISEGNINNNCPEEFYTEFIEIGHEQTQDYGIAENYDLYMFSILWHTTTCKTKGYQCYDLVKNIPKNIWGIHGLWPTYKNGTIPNWCNGKNDIDIEIKNETLLKIMQTYWISSYHTNEYFWGNEYNKHGYCYNQRNQINLYDYDKYFQKTLELFFKYDFANLFNNMIGDKIKPGDTEIKRSDIEGYFGKIGLDKYTYLLVCTNITSSTNINITYITEIRIKFDLDFVLYKNETDKSEFDCPETFMAEFL